MEYKNVDTPAGREVFLQGSLTFRDHDAFYGIIAGLSALKNKQVIFDLSGVDFVDSAILGLFVIASEETTEHNITFMLRGANGKVKEVMATSMFDKIFQMID